jgi:hexosaminidase
VPVHGWRGLHVDLARQFIPAVDVGWLIDRAAWSRLNRVHLHLTDDEGWRFPVGGYPALAEVGAWRGHGLAIPPLLGSGPEPYGGAYTAGDIHGWVARARALGIEIVPEVDLPGHCYAALAAVPELRDPADTSGAASVQHFVDNVLVPGLPSTGPFLTAVFGALADLFPGPWLHLGGDEVPPGAWAGSPAAAAFARERGVDGTDAIAAAFMGDVIRLVRTATGRHVGVWQEAAESGALQPEDGYVVAWRSSTDSRRLAAAGFDVVAAPADVYYLDMAEDGEWESPGASWAGSTSVAEIEAYDPTAGWTATERAHLLGVQACLWTEHVHDRATLIELLLPRLDAIAASAWTSDARFSASGGSSDDPNSPRNRPGRVAGRVGPCSQPHRSDGAGTTRHGSSSAPPASAGWTRAPPTAPSRGSRRPASTTSTPRPTTATPRSGCSPGSPTTRSSSPPRPGTGKGTPPGPRSSGRWSGWASTTSI